MDVLHDCSLQDASQVRWRIQKSKDTDTDKYIKTNADLLPSTDSTDDCNYQKYISGNRCQSSTEQLQWHAVVGALPSVVSWLQKLNAARRTLDPLPSEITGTAMQKQTALMKSPTTTDILRSHEPKLASIPVEKSVSQPDLVHIQAKATADINPAFQHIDSTKAVTHKKSRLRMKPRGLQGGSQRLQGDAVLHSRQQYMNSFAHSLLIKSQSKAIAEE
jgi:hypothetical protein